VTRIQATLSGGQPNDPAVADRNIQCIGRRLAAPPMRTPQSADAERGFHLRAAMLQDRRGNVTPCQPSGAILFTAPLNRTRPWIPIPGGPTFPTLRVRACLDRALADVASGVGSLRRAWASAPKSSRWKSRADSDVAADATPKGRRWPPPMGCGKIKSGLGNRQ
jgi:hypothetical protein